MNNNPKLQDMGEHAKQLLGLIQECKPDADLELLAEYIKQWKNELSKISTKPDKVESSIKKPIEGNINNRSRGGYLFRTLSEIENQNKQKNQSNINSFNRLFKQ